MDNKYQVVKVHLGSDDGFDVMFTTTKMAEAKRVRDHLAVGRKFGAPYIYQIREVPSNG